MRVRMKHLTISNKSVYILILTKETQRVVQWIEKVFCVGLEATVKVKKDEYI